MKTRLYVAFAIIAVIVLYLTVPFTSPAFMTGAISLSRPESLIRRDMLRITPIGTSKENVIEVIENRGWTVRFIRDTSGYFINRGQVSDGPSPFMAEMGQSVEVGTQSIRIFLGRGFAVLVGVYYAFDEDSKLIDIAIRRQLAL